MFYYDLEQFCAFDPYIYSSCLEYIKKKNADNTSKDGQFSVDDIWSMFSELCYAIFDESVAEMILSLQADFYLDAYIKAQGSLLSPITKNSFPRRTSEAIQGDPEDVRRRFDTIRADLEKSFSPLMLNTHPYSAKFASWFSSFWKKDEGITCFDEIDYAFYIRAYKHWIWYPDNEYGMRFSEVYKGLRDMFTHEGTRIHSDHEFHSELSSYLFNKIFKAVDFIDILKITLFDFNDLIYETKDNRRERSIILLMPLSHIPYLLRSKVQDKYIEAIKSYVNAWDDPIKALRFRKEYYNLIDLSEYKLPLAKLIFFTLLQNTMYQDTDKESMEKIAKALYDGYRLDSSHYYGTVAKRLKDLEDMKYKGSDNDKRSKPSLVINNNNNITLESLEVNFTYNFIWANTANYYDYSAYTKNARPEWIPNKEIFMDWSYQNLMQKAESISISTGTNNYLNYKKNPGTLLLPTE